MSIKKLNSITHQEVVKLFHLSQLTFNDDSEQVVENLDLVLDWIHNLLDVDVTGVEPMISPVNHEIPTCEDIVNEGFQIEDILSNAPDSDGTFFNVPKVIG